MYGKVNVQLQVSSRAYLFVIQLQLHFPNKYFLFSPVHHLLIISELYA